MLRSRHALCLVGFVLSFAGGPIAQAREIRATVETEDVVTTCGSPDNGAGPYWCYGAPLLARAGDAPYVSAMEVGVGVAPLCNTRWRLFGRAADGWKLLLAPDGAIPHGGASALAGFREREPCPVITTGNGRIFLSINPSTQPPGTQYGPCDPHLLRIDAAEAAALLNGRGGATPGRLHGEPVRPVFAEGAKFTDHSYRGIGADSGRGEILALNIDSVSGDYFWAFGDASGQWTRAGRIAFPIRACYPQAAVRNRAAHVLAIGDIVEPNRQWREYKREQTKREWDYVFRRLFYTSTPDVARTEFAPPVELDTVEATAGHITNLDLWIDSSGTAHVLYLRRTIASPLMRDRFFAGRPLVTTLEYRAIAGGRVVDSRTLLRGGDGVGRDLPVYARFHSTNGADLLAVVYCSGTRPDGAPFAENRLLPVLPRPEEGEILAPLVRIDLKHPFQIFFTAAERGGSRPSPILDLFGSGTDGGVLRYARVRIEGR